jgi:hypothetical protein
MRVEAASYLGRPTEFRWIGPWTSPTHDSGPSPSAGALVFEGLLLLLLIGGSIVARRNLRAGRGDPRGALRFAAAVFFVELATWALGAHHVAAPEEGWLLIEGFTNAAGMALGFWLIYMALEPFARRRWPQMLISWTRALAGRTRDPLVARDLLIGAAVGLAVGLLMGPVRVLLPPMLGIPGAPPRPYEPPVTFSGAMARLLSMAVYSAVWVLGIVFLLVLIRRIVRREWIAWLLVTLFFTGTYLGEPSPWLTLPLAAISMGILIAVTVRFGVLAAVVSETCRNSARYMITSADPSSWDFYVGMLFVGVVIVGAAYAARSALAGRPLFGEMGERRAEEA